MREVNQISARRGIIVKHLIMWIMVFAVITGVVSLIKGWVLIAALSLVFAPVMCMVIYLLYLLCDISDIQRERREGWKKLAKG